MILLVRHAIAMARESWDGKDAARPLTIRGERQATALKGQLDAFTFTRILSSHSVRCVGTVAPLAEARAMKVKTTKSLAEGAGAKALDLVLDLVDDAVLCTHGDVVEDVLSGLRAVGWDVPPDPPCAKGATWLLDDSRRATYLPPPA